MLLDDLMPTWDATRIEHRVLEGRPEEIYPAVLQADLLESIRRSPLARGAFAVRSAGEHLVAAVTRSGYEDPPPAAELRFGSLEEHGEWVRLGADPPREFTFGTVGRFWGGTTTWEEIDAADFAAFDTPGHAKIACSVTLRPYGEHRTLVSYESRTLGTDEEARRGFLRYWRVVSPGVGMVMRAALAQIEHEAGALVS